MGKDPFKYFLPTPPIGAFCLTLDKEQLNKNVKGVQYSKKYLNGFKTADILEKYILKIVTKLGEELNYIRYTCIPMPECELVVIAKVWNNGTCFIFSNSKAYLEMLIKVNQLDRY